MVILISKNGFQDNEYYQQNGHFTIIRGSIHQENTVIISVHPKTASKYMKQKLTELKKKQFYNHS